MNILANMSNLSHLFTLPILQGTFVLLSKVRRRRGSGFAHQGPVFGRVVEFGRNVPVLVFPVPVAAAFVSRRARHSV